MKVKLKQYWPLVCALLIFLFLRIINLGKLPIFADEAIYIRWAQLAWHDHTKRFISLTDGKPPLHTWVMIPFLKLIKDPLLAGRLLSVFSGFFTLAGVFLIVQRVFNKETAFIASLLTAISPFLVFYDRLAVADSLLTAIGVFSFYLTLLLNKKPDLGKSFLLGFCWGAGLLTKQSSLYFIFLSPPVFLLTTNFKEKKVSILKIFKEKIFWWLFSLGIAIVTFNIIKLSPFSHLISVRSYDYILGKREFLKDPLQLLWGNLKAIFAWTLSYQTLFGFIIFLLGLFFVFKNNLKKGLVLISWLLIPVLGSAAIGKIIFPRYFVFIQPWIIVFMSAAVYFFYKKNKISAFLLFIPWTVFSFLIVFKPLKAPLHTREQNQYLTTWSSGYGIKKISQWLKEHYSDQKAYVATEGYFGTLPDGLQVYLASFGNIEVYGIGQPIGVIPEELLQRAKEYPTFLVVNSTRFTADRVHLDLIEEYPKPDFPFLKESLLFFKIKE